MMLSALVPLIFICYFGTLMMTVLVFPQHYDWRFGVMSNLLSPGHNPRFHWFASLGLSLAGLCAVPFGGLGIGIICFNGCALRAARSMVRNRYGRGLLFLWVLITMLALVTITGSICNLLLAKLGVPGLLLWYQPLRLSPLWHLAFWEWIGSAAVFFFLVSAAWLLPNDRY
jgi:hypothetical protein